MKKTQIIMSTLLLLLLSSCTPQGIRHSLAHKTPSPLLVTQEDEKSGGGNPEVYIAHECLKSTSAQSCLNKLFSDERKIYISSYKAIKLAGRGSNIEKANVKFQNDEVFMIYLDSSNVKRPLSTNIDSAEISRDLNSVLFMLPIHKIEDEVLVKDKDGKVLLEYKVIR